ncbi:MAG: zf-HC2 domain-containing protein [Bacteroidota bacterium]
MKKILAPSKCLSAETLQAYLKEELDEEQRYEVENHLLDCPLCSAAVEGFAQHYDFEADAQLAELQAARPRAEVAPVVQLPRRRPWLNRIAAAMLLLIVASAALLYWQSQSNERLYRAYYERPGGELLAALRSAGASEQGDFARAIALFNEERYIESLPYFEAYLSEGVEDAAAQFYAGVAHLEAGQPAAATNYLKTARINSDQFYEEASWYLILTKVRMEEREEAKALLKELLKYEEGYYQKQAEGLLEQLKKE